MIDLAPQHRGPFASRAPIGMRLRERRRQLGLRQRDLALQAGISPSYLNLIESGRRSIGGAVLKRLADALAVPVDALDGAADRRLIEDLAALAAEPLLAPLRLDPASALTLTGQHADWARALTVLHRAYLERRTTVAALMDRIHRDPILAQTMHGMLSRVAAIRSAAEILVNVGDLSPAEERRFRSIVATESTRLSETARALIGHLEQRPTDAHPVSAAEEVDDFIDEAGNHFAGLETLAARWRSDAGLDDRRPDADVGRLDLLLSQRFSAPDADLGASGRRFARARRWAAHDGAGAIEAAIAVPYAPRGEQAAARARRMLVSYLAGAMVLPYEPFLAAAEQCSYDLDALARRFDASIEQICHRLATLGRPGREGIRFAFMRTDPSGFVSKRLSTTALQVPRYGSGCPLWPIYIAFQSPGATVARVVAFPDGARCLMIARTVEKPADPGQPRHLLSVMIACDALNADRTVYGRGATTLAEPLPVGPNCRVCERLDCRYRQENPIAGV